MNDDDRLICGRIGVGHGDDTSDPICQLAPNHGGPCDWHPYERDGRIGETTEVHRFTPFTTVPTVCRYCPCSEYSPIHDIRAPELREAPVTEDPAFLIHNMSCELVAGAFESLAMELEESTTTRPFTPKQFALILRAKAGDFRELKR